MNLNRRIFMAPLVLTLALVGCGNKDTAANAAAEKSAAVPVQVVAAQKGDVEDNAGLTGKLVPIEQVEVSSKVSAKISSLNVILGQKVSKGDVLFSLDQTDLENSVKQAQAAYQVALANFQQSENSSSQGVDQAKNSLNQSTNSIKQLENALAQAKQTLDDATKNEQRTQLLFDQGAISQADLEKAQTGLKNAQTAWSTAQVNLKGAEEGYANAKSTLGYASQKTAVNVASANVNQASVSLQNARTQLANATVSAPISGYVAKISGATGETASPQASVLTIVNTDTLLVRTYLSESEITMVKPGESVNLFIPAINKTLKAPIRSLSPIMDPQLKAYPMEVAIANDNNQYHADMVAEVKLPSPNQVKALVIPQNALLEEKGKNYVFKVVNNVAKQVEVTIGTQTSDQVEIKTGLSESDKVVVRGQTLLKDGSKVKVDSE